MNTINTNQLIIHALQNNAYKIFKGLIAKSTLTFKEMINFKTGFREKMKILNCIFETLGFTFQNSENYFGKIIKEISMTNLEMIRDIFLEYEFDHVLEYIISIYPLTNSEDFIFILDITDDSTVSKKFVKLFYKVKPEYLSKFLLACIHRKAFPEIFHEIIKSRKIIDFKPYINYAIQVQAIGFLEKLINVNSREYTIFTMSILITSEKVIDEIFLPNLYWLIHLTAKFNKLSMLKELVIKYNIKFDARNFAILNHAANFYRNSEFMKYAGSLIKR
jgi:hypothetical protein